ncbi:hypothetical protein NPX13_g3291 [Xylaria arbuscula]|uniref:Infection structure specific protein n=1 Tax=Xylaria arbuscula TaxID=114810 RepID=A0A9W8NIT7_9PEZI|nr:hypothetical protein NPX13_g3291 [Xylaria arbuscula]
MTGMLATGFVPATLLLSLLSPMATAQTSDYELLTATTIYPTGIPASCTPLTTLLSEYPPPKEGRVVDDALNNALDDFFSREEAMMTATATTERTSIDSTSFCDYIISTQIPSATPSATSSLSSYISAAGIWLDKHGLKEAESLLDGDCSVVVQSDEDEQAIGDLDFVIAFGPCYEALGWDKRTSTGSGSASATATTTTTDASTELTATPSVSQSRSTQATPSQTGQATETDAPPPNAGSKKVVDALCILGATVCATFLLL